METNRASGEMVDALVLGTSRQPLWEFESPLAHFNYGELKILGVLG